MLQMGPRHCAIASFATSSAQEGSGAQCCCHFCKTKCLISALERDTDVIFGSPDPELDTVAIFANPDALKTLDRNTVDIFAHSGA